MVTTLLGELAALEQSTDPEKREVGARLRTAIRNVLLDVIQELKVKEFLEEFPASEQPWDMEMKSTPVAAEPGWFYEEFTHDLR